MPQRRVTTRTIRAGHGTADEAARITPHAQQRPPELRPDAYVVACFGDPGLEEARELLAFARTRGVPELAVPRAVRVVDKVPLLGSGKTDYPAAQRVLTAVAEPVS